MVEFDDLEWEKREWLSVYKDGFHLFLLEESLVLAHRMSALYASSPAGGSLHPALVRIFAPNPFREIISLSTPSLFYLQTFKPLVDNVGLFKSKHQKQPVEFLGDLKLDFQDYNKLKVIRVSTYVSE